MALHLFPLLLLLLSCSLQKVALRSSTPIFLKSSEGLLTEGNWDFFQKSTPGNLKFMELIWQQDKENLQLLSLLIKGYAGYAYAVPETLAFGDELAGLEDSPWKKEAIIFYTRALDYGLLYLDKKGIKRKNLLANDETKLAKRLEDLTKDDATALLYTAQAWGSLINLQKNNVALITQVPKVKLIFDFVCKMKPDIDHNVCDIFNAQYESSRPKMLGGNPERGEELYLAAIKKYPHHLLIRINYIQFLLLPAFEAEKYEQQSSVLKEEFVKWENINRDNLENQSSYKDYQELNLYNSIAKKRFELIEKNKSKIF